MEDFGEEVVGKFLDQIKVTGGNILDKLKWKGKNIGMDLSDIGNVENFWDSFKNKFPDISGPYPNPTKPLEQT